MARFTTRVQLNGTPDRTVYERLHASMRKSGFAQTIKGDNGAEFELPHGEYIFEGEIPVGDVMTLARRAAEAVWPDVYILVSESTGRSWFLKMIKAAKAQPV